MATTPAYLPPQKSESIVSDFTGMFAFFADPAAAARRLPRKWFWIAPLIVVLVVAIIAAIAAIAMEPIVRQASALMPTRPGATPEQQQRAVDIGVAMQRFFAPVGVIVMLLIQTLIVFGAAAVFSVKARFREFFNLVTGCSLISMALTSIAGVIILRAKGEISSMAELTPALGLDIFLPQGTSKFLFGILGYFSIFQIWWMVMMVLIISAAFQVSKGKALGIITPLVILGLVFRIGLATFRGQS